MLFAIGWTLRLPVVLMTSTAVPGAFWRLANFMLICDPSARLNATWLIASRGRSTKRP